MKHLLIWALLAPGIVRAADPKVAECFKVNALLKMDGDYYWADWRNSCPYTIDSVYVAVEFADHLGKRVGEGLMALHLVMPGLQRVIRLSTPPTSASFERIVVRKITTDLEQAMHLSASAAPPKEIPMVSAQH